MKKNGFTIVELATVIVILGVLAIIAIPSVLNVVEGVRAVEAAYEIATKHNLELPIINMLHKILYENYPIKNVTKALLIRDLKSE